MYSPVLIYMCVFKLIRVIKVLPGKFIAAGSFTCKGRKQVSFIDFFSQLYDMIDFLSSVETPQEIRGSKVEVRGEFR